MPVGRPLGAHARPILAGLLVAAIGIGPWVMLARHNRALHPEVPWAALTTVVYLALLLAWLNGTGWPRRTTAWRRWHLRLWPTRAEVGASAASAAAAGARAAAPLVLGLGLLTLLWILVGRPAEAPELGSYPTTAYRFSVFVVGALVSGVVEEAAFRGYMQRGLEPFGTERAVVVTSVVFTLVHGVHGLGTLMLLGPGIFVASVLYGMLALRTGTVVPGMIIHTLGDLAYTFFGTLRGDGRLLFAP